MYIWHTKSWNRPMCWPTQCSCCSVSKHDIANGKISTKMHCIALPTSIMITLYLVTLYHVALYHVELYHVALYHISQYIIVLPTLLTYLAWKILKLMSVFKTLGIILKNIIAIWTSTAYFRPHFLQLLLKFSRDSLIWGKLNAILFILAQFC